MGKVFPGQPWRPETAAQRNGWDESADFYNLKSRRRDNPTKRRPIPTDLIKLRNDSGGSLAAGRVLEIGAKLITTQTRGSLLFEGDTPAAAGKGIAITTRQMASSPVPSIDWCQVSGVCLAQVNITNTSHRWADVAASNTLLQSNADYGRVEILRKLASGTGTKDCLVRIGTGPIAVNIVDKWTTFTWTMTGLSTGTNYHTQAGVEDPPDPGVYTHPNWTISSNKITCQTTGWYRMDFEAWGIYDFTSGGPILLKVQGLLHSTTSATPGGPGSTDVWYWRSVLTAGYQDSFRSTYTRLMSCTAGEWLTVVTIITGAIPQNMDMRITIGERIDY